MGIWNIIAAVAAWSIEFFLSTKLAKFAGVLAMVTVFLGLVLAFISAAYIALYSVSVGAPQGIDFALSFIPIQAPAMIGAYLSVLTMKRVLDYKKQLFDWVADPILGRVEGGLANRGHLPKRR